jgi:hypothetical protein
MLGYTSKGYFLLHEYDGCFNTYASPDHTVSYILVPFDVNADTGPVELQRGATHLERETHFRNAFRYARLLDI